MTNPHAWFMADLKSVPQKDIKVFSTFACGGGSTMGYKLAGCQMIGANDIDPEMAYHYKLNLHPAYYFLCPIKDLLKKDLPQELYELDILDGSPPCSAFSMAGNREKDWGKKKKFREGQSVQVLDDLFFDYLDLVDRLRPKVSIAENVKGMIQGNAKGYVKMVFDRYKEIGYRPQLFLVNAADCGVPQKRERVFFIAIRDDIAVDKLVLNPKHRWISAGEATSDLQVLTEDEKENTVFTANTDLKWWPLTYQGERYEQATIRAGLKPQLFNHNKLCLKNPSPSLLANEQMFKHWSQPKKLTLREWKRLGSFPDDYQAKNEKIGKYIIGMSVPPKMMYEVARAVIEQWLT
jgi:DNA (cytosine-5)-methyltransferase 1